MRLKVPPGAVESRIEIAGGSMRYLSAGEGPPLLLVHGLMGFSFSWSENIPAFAASFRVISPDLLNLGYSSRGEYASDLRATATQLWQFMDALNIERAHLVGNSHGGGIVLAMAAQSPRRVLSLTLVSPSHPASERSRWQITLFNTWIGAKLAPWFYHLPTVCYRIALSRQYAAIRNALPGTTEEYTRALKLPGTFEHLLRVAKSWLGDYQWLATVIPRLQAIPTLLVWGDKDRVVPCATIASLQQLLPQAELEMIPGAGHLPFEESPTEFNRRVLAWLLRQASTQMTSEPKAKVKEEVL